MQSFKTIAKDNSARVGVLNTPHGQINTPTFMPVGTVASVKALDPKDLIEAKTQIILGNTYHLNLRPTSEVIKKMGGLHNFMNWNGPILTDSGGFQAFSLGAMIEHGVRKSGQKSKSQSKSSILSKIAEEGIEFTSHLDGSKHFLSPTRSIDIQLNLASDICLCLDELLSPLATPDYVTKSLERTHSWETQSLKHFRKNASKSPNPNSLIFGIVQGVFDAEIRRQEAAWASTLPFDGISIGGSFGTSPHWGDDTLNWAAGKAIYKTLEWVIPLLPTNWPIHILGIGEVEDLFNCIELGADMFDCVAPTRRARNGSLYINPKSGGTSKNKFTLNITNSKFTKDPSPIDPQCRCFTCLNHSRAYLRHLYLAKELLYFRLASIHNVYFINNLVEEIRSSIKDKQFKLLKASWLP